MLPSFSFPGSEVSQLVCRSLYGNRGATGPAGSHYPGGLSSSYRCAFPTFDILPRTAENEQIPGEWFLFFIPYFIFQQILWVL